MKRSLLILSIAVSFTTSAQSWCPPGAQWTYQYSGQLLSGVTHASYTGDTILDGLPAQRIDHEIHAYQQNWPPMGEPGIWPQEPLFTHTDDDLVSLWNIWSESFDTLMWFGAMPGESWYMPHSEDFFFTVLDTGTTNVQGIPLRFLVVNNDMIGVDTLRERIGFDHHYLDPMVSMFIDHTTVWLQCYSDTVITNFTGSNAWFDCDIALATEVRTAHEFTLFPNPGTDHFKLQLPPGEHNLRILDQLGRKMSEMDRISDQAMIGTASLPPGIYTVLITDRNGRSSHQRWVKE